MLLYPSEISTKYFVGFLGFVGAQPASLKAQKKSRGKKTLCLFRFYIFLNPHVSALLFC